MEFSKSYSRKLAQGDFETDSILNLKKNGKFGLFFTSVALIFILSHATTLSFVLFSSVSVKHKPRCILI